MFSTKIDEIEKELSAMRLGEAEGEASQLVQRKVSHDPAVAALLWAKDFGASGTLDAFILDTSQRLKQDVYKGFVYAVVPLYATSICMEECTYCNYRAGNSARLNLERVRLSEEQLVSEARFLIGEKGLRSLELVYATDPGVRADSMCRHVELMQKVLNEHGGGSVGINAEALEISEYRCLVNAGLSYAVLWQETYDRSRYHEVHIGKTKKTNFEYRVDAYERMIEGGIKKVGMGILSGLSDWRTDWAMLMHHEHYLRKTYGVDAAVLGIPRLKDAEGAVFRTSPFIPTRQEFLVTVALHNVFSPETLPFVNTREDWKLCVELSRGGGCLFTFNCSTIPGGYSLGHKGYQFPTHSYDAVSYVEALQQQGMQTVFDWSLTDKSFPYSNRPSYTLT
jgi:2-iminoacetate synthase